MKHITSRHLNEFRIIKETKMATRSLIGMKKDDTVHYIYCHWDGYPSHHGPILNKYYNDAETVSQLIKLGDLSTLDKQIAPPEDCTHSFVDPMKGVCVFYGRDRNEKNVGPKTTMLENYLQPNYGNNYGADYKYLFSDNRWWVVNEKDLLENLEN